MGKKLYEETESGGICFKSERKSGHVRIPNYIYDLWLPLIGIDTVGVYSVYCRLEREGTVKAATMQDLANACRISKTTLYKINETLVKCGFIKIVKPEGHKRLMHWTTEVTVLDPPVAIEKPLVEKYAPKRGYKPLTPWLVEEKQERPDVLPSTSDSTDQYVEDVPDSTPNVVTSGVATSEVVGADAQNSDPLSEQTEPLHSEADQEDGEAEGDALLSEFFGPRDEPLIPLTAEPRSWFAIPPEERGRNTSVPVQAGGAHSPAEAVVEGICRYNYGYGMDRLPEKQRQSMIVKVAGILEEWGGATVGQAKLAWDAWTVRCAFKGRTANPFYTSFPNEFGPLLIGVRDGTITAAMLRAEADGNGRGKASVPTPEAVRVYR